MCQGTQQSTESVPLDPLSVQVDLPGLASERRRVLNRTPFAPGAPRGVEGGEGPRAARGGGALRGGSHRTRPEKPAEF